MKLLQNAEDLTSNCKFPNVDYSQGCSTCQSNISGGNNNIVSNVRLAAFREKSNDNFLFCPDAFDMANDETNHFQIHWMRGEPVIVRNVLDKTSGLSWEPMVMWRAFRETGGNVKFKDETRSVKAIDCLDWCEVGYLNNLSYSSKMHAKSFTISAPDNFELMRSHCCVG